MQKWLLPPQYSDEYRAFAARVLHYTLLLFIVLTLISLLFVTEAAQFMFIPPLLAVLTGCYLLLHTGRYQTAGLVFLSGAWLIITIASLHLNGLRNSSFSSYAIIILFAAVLFSEREVLIFTGLSILSGVVMFAGENAGVLPLSQITPVLADRFFQSIALFVAAGLILSATARAIRASVVRIREHEQLLLERNRALESEVAERKRAEAARLFGTTPEAMTGRTLYDYLERQDAEAAKHQQSLVMASGKPDLSEGVVTLPNGQIVHYMRHVMPLPTLSENDKQQVLVITTDVSRRKIAEQQERELTLARERNAFLTDFFSTVSHDLKTPLTVLNTSLYLLERVQDPAQRQAKLLQMKDQIALVDRYIQDILTVSRLEYLPQLHAETIDISVLVEEVIERLRPRIEGKNLTCQVNMQDSLCSVKGDPDQLRRALVNLVENAVNYTPGGGRLYVTARCEQRCVVVEVADTGIGISAEALPHIFDRFYRAPEARQLEGGGSGLGLAIVQKIVALHNANIRVESQPGQGTTFRIQFPSPNEPLGSPVSAFST